MVDFEFRTHNKKKKTVRGTLQINLLPRHLKETLWFSLVPEQSVMNKQCDEKSDKWLAQEESNTERKWRTFVSGTVSAVAVNTRVNCKNDQVYVARTAKATPCIHHRFGSWSKTSNNSVVKLRK